jgi:hypothetical protein
VLASLLSKNVNIKICTTIILYVVLYGCETWSLTLWEEHRLKVFENRVSRTFGPKRDEMVQGWRKLHNEELHSLYSLQNIINKVKEGELGREGNMHEGEKRNSFRILVGKPVGKRALGRPSNKWKYNIKMALR